jgi:hypothetical protein
MVVLPPEDHQPSSTIGTVGRSPSKGVGGRKANN